MKCVWEMGGGGGGRNIGVRKRHTTISNSQVNQYVANDLCGASSVTDLVRMLFLRYKVPFRVSGPCAMGKCITTIDREVARQYQNHAS